MHMPTQVVNLPIRHRLRKLYRIFYIKQNGPSPAAGRKGLKHEYVHQYGRHSGSLWGEEWDGGRGQQVTQVSAEATGGRNKVRGSWGPPWPRSSSRQPPSSRLWRGSVERDTEVGGGHIALTSLFPPDPGPAVTFVLLHETEVFTLGHGDGALAGPCRGRGSGLRSASGEGKHAPAKKTSQPLRRRWDPHAGLTFKVVDGHTVPYGGCRLLLKILIKLRVDGGILALLGRGLLRAGWGERSRSGQAPQVVGTDPVRPPRSPLLGIL